MNNDIKSNEASLKNNARTGYSVCLCFLENDKYVKSFPLKPITVKNEYYEENYEENYEAKCIQRIFTVELDVSDIISQDHEFLRNAFFVYGCDDLEQPIFHLVEIMQKKSTYGDILISFRAYSKCNIFDLAGSFHNNKFVFDIICDLRYAYDKEEENRISEILSIL